MLFIYLRSFAPSLLFGLAGALLIWMSSWFLHSGPLLLLPLPLILGAQFYWTKTSTRWMLFLQLLLTFFIALGLDRFVFSQAAPVVLNFSELFLRGMILTGIGILLAGLFATHSKPVHFS